ncbi:hypothetical protein GC173_17675 [bacterium]|nr:hypothetical protein [bacterium]
MNNPMRSLIRWLVPLALVFVVGCGAKKPAPYSPHENLLSIAAEFQLLAARDPYAEPEGRDLTGASIARVTLTRAANYEALHPGRFTPEVLVLKARALELMGDYATARRNLQEAASFDTEMKDDCNARARTLDLFILAGGLATPTGDAVQDAKRLADQAAEFRRIASTAAQPYRGLALREAEESEVRRAELLVAGRLLIPNGEAEAVAALEQLVATHRASARAYAHVMRLARFHRELAEQLARLSPPDRPGFPFEKFRSHFDAASDLLYRVAQADGFPERAVARHELDALLAWGQTIQDAAR